MQDMSGFPWIVAAIGIALAGIAMAYGLMNSRRKTAGENQAQQSATRQLYRDEPE